MADFNNSQLWLVAMASLICLLILINLAYSVFHFKRFSPALKWLTPYFAFSFFCESFSIFKFIRLDSTLGLINAYTIGEFFFVASFIGFLTQKQGIRRRSFVGIVAAVAIGFGIYLIWFNRGNVLLSYSETLENMLLMGLCIYFFIHSLNKPVFCKPEENSLVKWVIIGHFIYLSGIILFWLSFDFLKSEFQQIIAIIVYFNAFLNLGLKITILVALLAYDHRMRRKQLLGT